MDDMQRLRYSRHLLLPEWSEDVQARVLAAHALVIGAGGLGAPALMYLASAGVGRITVVDHDRVELSNLQRQVIHSTPRLGWPKVESARETLGGLNPQVVVNAVHERADDALLRQQVPLAQVVLDCTDRFDTRHLINRVCRELGVPLVSASAVGWDGQLAVFDPRQPTSPCYACLFPPDQPPEDTPCATLGVFAPLVGMLGVMQAGEALKLLAGVGVAQGHAPAVGRLVLVDGRQWQISSLGVARQAGCPVCGTLI